MALKVFWYRCGRQHGNFGDVLTPTLLKHLGIPCEWAPADQADVAGIGSICEKIPANFRGIIWTAGNLRKAHRNQFFQAQVRALRGTLTLRRTDCVSPENVLLGDGGLLCHLLASRVAKRYKLGLVPHYVDHGHDMLKPVAGSSKDICLIDVCSGPDEVIRRVAQCEYILSSSLHGLILADSLGIASRWLAPFGNVLGDGFKFRDYYSVYGIDDPTPLTLSQTDSLETLLPQIGTYHRPGIDHLQETLLACLKDMFSASHKFVPPTTVTRSDGTQLSAEPRHVRNAHHDTSRTVYADSSRPPGNRRRIFVVGTGRSGTCWLGDLLGTHSEIRSFVEPRPVFDLVTSVAVNSSRKEALLESIIREYERLFSLVTPFHFADKTHPVLWMAEDVAAQFDDAVFIAMLRDVEPTVASMLRHKGVRRWCEEWSQYPVPNRFLGITVANLAWYSRATIIERCVARWWAHRNEILRLAPILNGRMLVVKYESLVTNTRSSLQAVEDFLGLSETFPDTAARSDSLNKWMGQLGDDEISLIRDTVAFLAETNHVESR